MSDPRAILSPRRGPRNISARMYQGLRIRHGNHVVVDHEQPRKPPGEEIKNLMVPPRPDEVREFTRGLGDAVVGKPLNPSPEFGVRSSALEHDHQDVPRINHQRLSLRWL